MKFFLLILSLASTLCIKVQCIGAPNFIFILTDDQGWTSLSAAIDPDFPNSRSDYHKTPHIDKLMKMGVNFTDGYAPSPVCSPSRYSIQFGKTPARLKKTIVRGENNVDHKQISIAQLLKNINKDYLCGHLGKWHIDVNPSYLGYDIHDGITTNAEGNFHNDNHKLQWGGYSEGDPKRVYSLTDRSISFIEEAIDSNRPFYLQLSHYAVHSDLVYSNESFAEMILEQPGEIHTDTSYAAMIMDLDKSIGKLLEAYENLGLGKNTYIIFTSDNGGMPVLPIQVNRGKPYKNGLNSPLARGKWDLMEGGIRVPFFISGPGIMPNQISDIPVIGYDIFPTVADLAQLNKSGIKFQMPENLDGVSLVNLLKKDTSISFKRPNDGLIFHFPHYNICGLNEPHSAIRIGNHKLVKFYTSERILLFDLSVDVAEKNDISPTQKSLSIYLESKLEDYLEKVGAEVPEESFSWGKNGKNGQVKTQFFQRY